MMRPKPHFVTIPSDVDLLTSLLNDLFLQPRAALMRWSRVTNQTAQVRIAYPGQHLASLVTGVQGAGTAARGDDLLDGSEVKSCSRADQLGSCRECEERVLPFLEECPSCGSKNIIRKQDSHWILSIKSEQELHQYLEVPRIVLILFDRIPSDLSKVRSRIWEIWPTYERHQYFEWFVMDYWENNYSLKRSKGLTPAPLNLHPLKFDFFMMNPVLVFEAHIDVESTDAEIVRWVGPMVDRGECEPEPMPPSIVKRETLQELVDDLTDAELAACLHGSTSSQEAALLRRTVSSILLAEQFAWLTESARLKLRRPTRTPKMTPSSYTRHRRT